MKKKKAILIAWQHHVEFLELFLSLFKGKTLTPPTYPNLPITDSTQRWWWSGISLGATFIQQNTPEYILALRQIMSFNYVKKSFIKPTFQCRFIVVSSLKHGWNNIERRCCNGFSNLNNVILILFQHWYNITSTLFQRGLNFSWSNIKTNLASDKYGFANILIFIALNEENGLQLSNYSTTNKPSK